MKSLSRSPYAFLYFIGLGIFLITAFFSLGCHHPDEHFQILEFASYKLGNSPATDLPWEFHEQIRPGLQPFIAYCIIWFFNLVGIHNPFTLALILRLLTALLSWFILCHFIQYLIGNFVTLAGKKLFVLMSLFLWFVPYIFVRFSSETMAGVTFLSGLLSILKALDNKSGKRIILLIISGLCLGFSFYFRFQIGVAILGLGLWLLIIGRPGWKDWLIFIPSGITAIAICILLDYWFYGEWVMSPVNYYIANIVQNKAAAWGVYPWWYYFELFTLTAIPPISVVLLSLFLLGLYRNKTNVFTFILVPFLLIHMIIGHKEMRFMFPIIFGFIYIASLGLDFMTTKLKPSRIYKYGYWLLVSMNLIFLVYVMFFPAREIMKAYKYVYNNSYNEKTEVLCIEKDLYELANLKVNFYRPANIEVLVFRNEDDINDYLIKSQVDSALIYLCKPGLNYEFITYSKQQVCTMFPSWILKNNFNHWQDRSGIWSIYEVKRR